jgi:2-polyprenyl-6-methoxyphenol hydroxylase-like FAD-dependent oxidoreductase
MATQRSAIVIGGSLGGLTAANLLHRAGWDVQVHERVAEELEGRGAGIVTHPELLAALAEAGVVIDESIGVRVAERVVLSHDGSVQGRHALPQVLTAWARLYQALRDALPLGRYHNGRQLVRAEQDADGVTAHFADGSSARADLLVAADGVRSSVRQALLPDVKPVYAGYLAWRGLVEESALSARTREELVPYFAFGLPPREQMVAYPVAGRDQAVEPGRRRFNFVWYRPADEHGVLRDLLTDAQGRHWPDGIPPPLLRAQVIADARKAAHDVLAPQFAEVVEKTPGLFFQPIFDLESPQLAFGRIALMGDAAFVARPHCGMGVAKAAGDALALVAALRLHDDVATGLQAYSQVRQPAGAAVVAHARALGRYMQSQLSNDEERAMAERYRSPEAIMRETAIPPPRAH